MRIDQVNVPDIRGKSVQQALEILHKHCHETAVRLMHVNNDLEDLKAEVARLRQGR